jgi:hypothetical protein
VAVGGLSCFTLSRGYTEAFLVLRYLGGIYNNGLNTMQQNASGDHTECKPLPEMFSTGNGSIGGTIKQNTTLNFTFTGLKQFFKHSRYRDAR